MPLNRKSLEKILRIAHDTSIRGKGISLSKALRKAKYSQLRKDLSSLDLLRIIEEKPSFIQDWISYSQDKRTSGGFYLSGKIIGSLDKSDEIFCDNEQIATAMYVIKELDFWSKV